MHHKYGDLQAYFNIENLISFFFSLTVLCVSYVICISSVYVITDPCHRIYVYTLYTINILFYMRLVVYY